MPASQERVDPRDVADSPAEEPADIVCETKFLHLVSNPGLDLGLDVLTLRAWRAIQAMGWTGYR